MSPSPAIRLTLGLLAVFLLAGALRAGTDVLVVQDDGVHFTVPGDPYYHMRRIAWSVERFPAVLGFDRYLNHPRGGQVVWPPAFDWSLAAAARLLVGAGDPRGVERVAARAPALIGALAAVGVVLLARRRFSAGAGWAAGLLLAVLPNHILHSQVGQLDHHVAVSAFTIVLLASVFGLLTGPPPSARRASLSGLCFAGALLLWPGMLIHVGLLDATLVLWALLAPGGAGGRDDAIARARAVAWVNASAFVAITPFAIGQEWVEFGAWSPWVLSGFQPAFFLAATAVLWGASRLWGFRGVGATRAARLASAGVLGFAGLALSFLAIPDLAAVLDVAAGWFAKEESFQRNVSELQPFYPSVAVLRYSHGILLFPLLWGWLAFRAWRDGAGADRFVLLGMTAAFFGLAALQRRFGNTFSIFFVLLCAWGVAEAAPRVRARLAARPGLRWPVVAAATLAGLWIANSFLAFHLPRQETLDEGHSDPARARRGPLGVRHRIFDAASVWLGQASPPTAGWIDPEAVPEYGILAAWDAGHMIRYRTRRPMVQDNFGVYGGRESFEAAARYYAERDETAALAILEALGVRYVLADHHGSGAAVRYAPDSMTVRLATHFGSASEDAQVPALQHHRLLWHQRSGTDRSLDAERGKGSAVGVWEIVAGARVHGRAEPEARVEARIQLQTGSGRRHLYRTATRADAAGRYALVLPYPTDRRWSSAMSGAKHWTLESGGESAALEVPEAAVQAGSEIPGPALAPSG